MKSKVQMWGNSLALRIPKPFAAEVGLENETPVDLSLEDGKLIITKSKASYPKLEDLLSEITTENIHREIDVGGPVGNEAW